MAYEFYENEDDNFKNKKDELLTKLSRIIKWKEEYADDPAYEENNINLLKALYETVDEHLQEKDVVNFEFQQDEHYDYSEDQISKVVIETNDYILQYSTNLLDAKELNRYDEVYFHDFNGSNKDKITIELNPVEFIQKDNKRTFDYIYPSLEEIEVRQEELGYDNKENSLWFWMTGDGE